MLPSPIPRQVSYQPCHCLDLCLTAAEEKSAEQNDSDDWDDVDVQEVPKNKPHSSEERSPAPASQRQPARELSLPPVKAEIDLSSDNDSVQAVDSPKQTNGQPKAAEKGVSSKGTLPGQSSADLQTSREAGAVPDKKPEALVQMAQGAERIQKVEDQSHGFKEGQKGISGEPKAETNGEAEPAQNKISPFKAQVAQQTPISRDSPRKKASDLGKAQKSKAGQDKKAKKKLHLSSTPQAGKERKGRGTKEAAPLMSKGRDKAAAEVHEARLKTSGAEPSLPASSPKDEQRSVSGHPAAETNISSSNDARKGNAIESGKAVLPNGKLRAFADPDELPQTKHEPPHVERTGDMPSKFAASTQKKSQEAGQAIEGGRSMDQAQDQAMSPIEDEFAWPEERESPDPRESQLAEAADSKAVSKSLQSAEGRSKAKPVKEKTGAQASAAQGLHNPDPSTSRQHPRPADPTPESFSDFAAAVDTATPMGTGAAARPQPSAQATAAQPQPSAQATAAGSSQQPKKRPGLRPIPDSTMLDPDPEAGRGQNGANLSRGGPPRVLRPIPDSSILEPDSPRKSLFA